MVASNGNGQSQSGQYTEAAKYSSKRLKRPLFIYPQLPSIELKFYIAIVFCTAIYAWSRVLIASNKFVFKFGQPATVHYLPLIGERFKVSELIEKEKNQYQLEIYNKKTHLGQRFSFLSLIPLQCKPDAFKSGGAATDTKS